MDYPELSATPVKRDWAMKVANALRAGRDIGNKVTIPEAVPLLGGTGLGDFFVPEKSPDLFERIAYDEPFTQGSGWARRVHPDARDEIFDTTLLALDVVPAARSAAKGAVKGADRLAKAVSKNRELIQPAVEAVK